MRIESVKRSMKTMALWKRLLIILIVMLLIRVGTVIPIPFVNKTYMQSVTSGGTTFLSMLLGGSMSQMSLFALSISPYITASIVVQLMTVVIPKLEEIQKDGKTGQDRYKRIVSITGIVFSFTQAILMAIGFGSQGLLDPYTPLTVAGATAIWTVGAIILILIGEFLDNFQLGSGISMILLCNILSSIPTDGVVLWNTFISGQTLVMKGVAAGTIALIFLLAIVICVSLTTAVRTIPVKMSGKIAGYSPKQDIPIPLMTCNVMPYIFASSILSIPAMIVKFFPSLDTGIFAKIVKALTSTNWFLYKHPVRCLGAVVFIVLTYFFTLFYINFAFNAQEMAINLKKQGAFVAGIRPGRPTEEYLEKIIREVAVWGNGLMVALIMIITAICNISGAGTLSLSGTSLIIAVSVLYDLYNRIKSEKKAVAVKRNKISESVLNVKNANRKKRSA